MLTGMNAVSLECCNACYCNTASGSWTVAFSWPSGCPTHPQQGSYVFVSGHTPTSCTIDKTVQTSVSTICYSYNTSGVSTEYLCELYYAYGDNYLTVPRDHWKLNLTCHWLYENPYGSPRYKYFDVMVFSSALVDKLDFACAGDTIFLNSINCSGASAVVST